MLRQNTAKLIGKPIAAVNKPMRGHTVIGDGAADDLLRMAKFRLELRATYKGDEVFNTAKGYFFHREVITQYA